MSVKPIIHSPIIVAVYRYDSTHIMPDYLWNQVFIQDITYLGTGCKCQTSLIHNNYCQDSLKNHSYEEVHTKDQTTTVFIQVLCNFSTVDKI